jgi:hypothetical protein
MVTDDRTPNQTEADEKKRSRRGGGVGEEVERSRVSSLPEAGRAAGSGDGVSRKVLYVRQLLKTFGNDRDGTRQFAQHANYSEAVIREALDACSGDGGHHA